MSTTDTTCTCPSGDGSLRWPCPTHPPTERAQRLRAARATVSEVRAGRHTLSLRVETTLTDLDDEVTRLDAVVTAVREEHRSGWVMNLPDGDSDLVCGGCGHIATGADDPCPTVRALDGGAR